MADCSTKYWVWRESTDTKTEIDLIRPYRSVYDGVCCAERPVPVISEDGRRACLVCGDIANGLHFGAQTCEGCKVCTYYVICYSTLLSEICS